MNPSDASPAIKRATRTYGKPRKTEPEPDHDYDDANDTSFATSSGDASHDSLSESPGGSMPPDSSDNEGLFDSSMVRDDEGGFTFGWKKDLQALDDDDDDLEGAPPAGELALKLTQLGTEEASRPTLADSAALLGSHHIPSPSKIRPKLADDDVSRILSASGSHASFPFGRIERDNSAVYSSQTQRDREAEQREDEIAPARSHARSPSPPTRRVRRRRAVLDSDSNSDSGEAEDKGTGPLSRARLTGRDSSASAETSPDKLHHIGTPQPGTSQTPPSSQEMAPKQGKPVTSFVRPPRISFKLRTPTDKGKARADEADTSGEQLSGVTAVSDHDPRDTKKHGQNRRKKNITKKDQEDSQKVTTRMRAAGSAHLERTDRPLSTCAMLAKIQKDNMSDPIDEWTPDKPPNRPPKTIVKPVRKLDLEVLHPKRMPRSRLSTVEPRGKEPEMRANGLLPFDTILGGSTSGTGGVGLDRGRPITAEHSRASTPAGFDDTENPFHTSRSTSEVARRRLVQPALSATVRPSCSNDSSDEELPSTADIVAENRRKREEEERVRHLRERKLAILQRREHETRPSPELQDDDDLQIVQDDAHETVKEESRARRTNRPRESEGRKRQLAYARVAPKAKSKGKQPMDEFERNEPRMQQLRDAVPSWSVAHAAIGPSTSKGRHAGSHLSKADLDRMLLKSSREQDREITKQKEQEFYRLDKSEVPSERWRAQVARGKELEAKKRQTIADLAERAMKIAAKREAAEDDADADSEDDGEWIPEQGEEEEARGSESAEEGVTGESGEGEGEGEELDDDENDENVPHAPQRHAVPSRVIVDSDEEDDFSKDPQTRPADSKWGRVLVPNSSQPTPVAHDAGSEEDEGTRMPASAYRASVSSAEETDRNEEETDKENDESLKFDRGPDKENTVISQQPSSPFGAAGVGLGQLRRGPSASLLLLDTPSSEGDRLFGVRSPLQELRREEDDDDDPFGPPNPNLVGMSSSPSYPSRQHSPRLGPRDPKTPRPLSLGGSLEGFFGEGLSALAPKADAFKTPDPSSLKPAAVILPGNDDGGFSQFDDDLPRGGGLFAEPKGFSGGGFSQFATPVDGRLGKLRARSPENMLLTMEEQRPHFTLDEQAIEQANDIFDKQQEIVVGGAFVPDSAKAVKMYINPYGFPTQTKTDSAHKTTPWGSKRSPLTSLPVITPFVPLEDRLQAEAMMEEPDSVEPRRGRLRKRAVTPDGTSSRDASPSPTPGKGKGRARNAYDVLGKKPLKALQLPKRAQRLEKSEFVAGEAVESDEENIIGFGPLAKDDDEGLDGEDQDQDMPELVDNKAMDTETLAEDMVREKFQEHLELDDAQNEKLARDAAEGRMRMKRRNQGLDLDDDISDDENDPDAKRRRERMRKKQRREDATLDELEKHPETKAFVTEYHANMEDDNEEFDHLKNDDHDSLPLGDNDVERDGDDEDEDEDEVPREQVSFAAIQQECREVARNKDTEAIDIIDVDDTSWMDTSDPAEDEDMEVTELTRPAKQPPRTGHLEPWEYAKFSRTGSAQDVAREKKWARSEGGARNGGTGRGSAAVTSLIHSKAVAAAGGKPGVKAGGGSIAGRRVGKAAEAPQPQAGPSTRRASKLAKAPSALGSSALSRRGKFTK